MGIQEARAFMEVSVSLGILYLWSLRGLPGRSWSLPPGPVPMFPGLPPADRPAGEAARRDSAPTHPWGLGPVLGP